MGDLRIAVRNGLRTPIFSIMVVLILAAGIAVTTAAFGLVRTFFLRDLPFQQANQLVHIWQTELNGGTNELRVSGATFREWQQSAHSLERLGAYNYAEVTAEVAGAPLSLRVGRVSPEVFQLLAVNPALGRTFTVEEASGGQAVCILSWRWWQDHYESGPEVIGKTVRVDGVIHEVIGVMPESFSFPLNSVRMWVPAWPMSDPALKGTAGPWLVIGRLKEGRTLDDADAELSVVSRRLNATIPADQQYGTHVVPLRRALVFLYDQMQLMTFALSAAVVFVLVLSCANLASLMLVRHTSRSHEMAVRAALGGGRGRLILQLVIEGAVLAIAGSVVGVATGLVFTRLLERAIPEDFYRVSGPMLDAQVALFALGVSVLTLILFAGIPAYEHTRVDLSPSLHAGGRGASQSRRATRLRTSLAMFQIAFATILLGGALFCLHLFTSIRSSDSNLRTNSVLTYEVALPETHYASDQSVNRYYDEMLMRIRSMPGVREAATVHPLPLNFELFNQSFGVNGHSRATASRIRITPGYFGLMGISILHGRDFAVGDSADAPIVVVVNQKLADAYWPGESAIGRQIQLFTPQSRPATVIAIVENSKEFLLNEAARPQIFEAQSQFPTLRRFFVVRVTHSDLPLADELRREHLKADAGVLPANLRTMQTVVEETLFPLALVSIVLGILGGGALGLAAMGVYGTIAYATALRTREFAIRMAIGATPGEVRKLVLGQTLRWALWGLLAGGLGAGGLGRLISALLGPLGSGGWFALIGGAFLMLVVTVTAAYFPARRAAGMSPLVALHTQ